jgi:hypothetical protein
MATSLPDTVANRVERLCSEGDAFAADARYAAATLRFTTAFRLLPRPQERWTVTPKIFASVVDACLAKGDLISARHAALAALDCPDVRDNAALHLRLGEIYFEEGNLELAREELALAFKQGGQEVFEDEDPKYWEFLSEVEDL